MKTQENIANPTTLLNLPATTYSRSNISSTFTNHFVIYLWDIHRNIQYWLKFVSDDPKVQTINWICFNLWILRCLVTGHPIIWMNKRKKNTFEKYYRNNFGATKIFIAEISIVPSQLTLISSLIVQENEIRTLCNNVKLI